MPRRSRFDTWFLLKNLVVWLAMVFILVVVPDSLEHWMPLTIARVVGWALACGIWVSSGSGSRFGPLVRFAAGHSLGGGASIASGSAISSEWGSSCLPVWWV